MEDVPTTRDGIAEAITADLQAAEQAPPPAPAAEAAPAAPPAEAPATPAPAAPTTPQAKTLADTDVVVDPADGQPKPWGEIKAERLRQADYTKKTMALAEERRRVAEFEANLKAQAKLAEVAAAQKAMPDLPEDDPYAQHIKAQREQLAAIAEYQRTMEAQLAEQVRARELEASNMALRAKEQELATSHGLSKREIEMIESEYMARVETDPNVTLDALAQQLVSWKAQLETEAVKKWQEKNRVSSPAASVTVPAAGAVDKTPVPGTRGFADAIREELAGLIR